MVKLKFIILFILSPQLLLAQVSLAEESLPTFSSLFEVSRLTSNSLSLVDQGTPRTVLLSGVLLSSALILTQENTSLKAQNHMVKNKPLGDWAEVGDLSGQLIPNAIYFGTYYILGTREKDHAQVNRSFHMFESSLYSGVFTTIAKLIAHRQRPDKSDHKSMPSGHSTTAFAFAATVGINHGWLPTVGAYSLATLVGLSRMNDNRHYLHDVIAGAAIGIAYSYGVAANYSKSSSTSSVVYLNALEDGSGLSLNKVWAY